MEQFDKEDIERTRIPAVCPFCGVCSEFKVFVAYPKYVVDGEWRDSRGEPRVNVECTNCFEEIREEDVENGSE